MKVIACKDDGYIIDMTKDEMANLYGLYGKYNSEFPIIKEGDNINVEELYLKFRSLSNLDYHRGNLKSIIDNLNDISKNLEFISITKDTELTEK